jgi:plastocyanin
MTFAARRESGTESDKGEGFIGNLRNNIPGLAFQHARKTMAVAVLLGALCAAGIAAALIPAANATTTVNVTVQNFSFNPPTIKVVIGVNNTITWTNKDSTNHAPTANDGSWGGTTGADGGTYTHTFTTAGSFPYHCAIHPTMTGTVVVLSAGTTSTTTTTTTTTAASSSTTTTTAQPSTTSSTTSSSSSSGGVPEFPYSIAAVVSITALVVVSYLFTRRSSMSGRLGVPRPRA